jgi:Uma2 family endonuclease
MTSLAVTLKNAMAGLPEGASIHLPNVRWDTYTSIVKELDGEGRVRVAYDRGDLYLMTKSRRHEIISRLFFPLIEVLVEARGGDFLSIGEATLNSQLAERGIEADECFYFNHIAEQHQEKDYDLAVDPPPDLAIEVDFSNSSVDKDGIYAALRVPELWRYEEGEVTFYRLVDGAYEEIAQSAEFPNLSADVLPQFFEIGQTRGTLAMKRAFASWLGL